MNKKYLIIAFTITLLIINLRLFSQNSYPIVLKGNLTPCLLGLAPSDIVGYKYESGQLIQIPIQIDEMVVLDLTAPYGPNQNVQHIVNYPSPVGMDGIFYADSTTYVGADTNLLFDIDDELAFMWADLGDKTTLSTYPVGTLSGSCCEVKIVNPLNNLDTSYLYLYEQDGSLDQTAGVNYVTYNFNLLAGSYPADYDFNNGSLNKENSVISTDTYKISFSNRWVTEETRIKKGTSPLNISGRHQNFFSPSNCSRTEDSFSRAEGAFMTNKDGCIRAIRSYMGANSGALTQRTNVFYAAKQEITFTVRVHIIGGFYDVFDNDSSMIGGISYNNLNPAGLDIDGVPDTHNKVGDLNWELIQKSDIGSLGIIHEMNDDFAPSEMIKSYYWEDNTTNPNAACTGDSLPIGMSGIKVKLINPICTDPHSDCYSTGNFRNLELIRHVFYDTTMLTVAQVQQMDTVIREGFSVVIGDCTPLNTTGLKGLDKNDVFQIYPNPFNNELIVKSKELIINKIDLLDFSGKIQRNVILGSKTERKVVIPTSSLAKGVYYIRVNNQHVYKLIKI